MPSLKAAAMVTNCNMSTCSVAFKKLTFSNEVNLDYGFASELGGVSF